MATAEFPTAKSGWRGTEDSPKVLGTNRGPLIRLFFAWGSEALSVSTDSTVFRSNGAWKGFVIIVEASRRGFPLSVTSSW